MATQIISECHIGCHYLNVPWSIHVTFDWNALLNVSGVAATKTLGSLLAQLLFEVLGESTRTVRIWVICGG